MAQARAQPNERNAQRLWLCRHGLRPIHLRYRCVRCIWRHQLVKNALNNRRKNAEFVVSVGSGIFAESGKCYCKSHVGINKSTLARFLIKSGDDDLDGGTTNFEPAPDGDEPHCTHFNNRPYSIPTYIAICCPRI